MFLRGPVSHGTTLLDSKSNRSGSTGAPDGVQPRSACEMGGYIATGAPGRKEKRQKSQKPEAPASGLVDLAVWAGPAGSEARLYQLCHASWPGIVWLRSAKPPCKLYNSSRKTALSLHCVAQAPRSHGGSARPRLSSRQRAALAIRRLTFSTIVPASPARSSHPSLRCPGRRYPKLRYPNLGSS